MSKGGGCSHHKCLVMVAFTEIISDKKKNMVLWISYKGTKLRQVWQILWRVCARACAQLLSRVHPMHCSAPGSSVQRKYQVCLLSLLVCHTYYCCWILGHEWEDSGPLYCGTETRGIILKEQKGKILSLLFKLPVSCDRPQNAKWNYSHCF